MIPKQAPPPPKQMRQERQPRGCLLMARPFFHRLSDKAEQAAGSTQITDEHIMQERRNLRNSVDSLTGYHNAMEKLAGINNSLWNMLKQQPAGANPAVHLAVCEELLLMLREQIKIAKKASPKDIGLSRQVMRGTIRLLEKNVPAAVEKIEYLRVHGELPADDRGLFEVQLKQ